MLTFGVTVLPDPPHTRFLELMQLAEAARLRLRLDVRLAHPLARRVPAPDAARVADGEAEVRALRHEPGDARADGDRQLVRDAACNLGRTRGAGHRQGRLGAARDRPAAREDGRVRGVLRDDQGPHERPARGVEREGARAHVGQGPGEDPALHRRLRAARARRRGPDRRRRHHPARRPDHHPVAHGAGPRGGRRGRARPGRARVPRLRAEHRHRRHPGAPGTRRAGSRPWSPTTSWT